MEAFYSIQGEGFHTGKPAFFARIGGCDVGCSWCDVKESWNASVWPLTPADEIVTRAMEKPARSIVITGGEPLIYNLDYLCNELKKNGFTTFLETSGSHPLSGTWDWICLSPKKSSPSLKEIFGISDELKVVIQHEGDFEWAEKNRERAPGKCRLFLQPEWSRRNSVMEKVIDYIKDHPEWSLSLQTHKYCGIP